MTDPIYAQIFCTAAELDDDLNLLGSVRADVIYEKIAAASDYLQKNIGWFIPVSKTQTFSGDGRQYLYISPLLALTGSIVNYQTVMNDSDFIQLPSGRHWADGPYSRLDIASTSFGLNWSTIENAVSIPGRWGLYEKTEDTSATVADATSQNASQITLTVANGALLSPGMVLLIGSEQELVTGWVSATASVTTLGAALDANSSEVTLAAALLNVGEIGRVGLEQFKVLDKNGTLYYVQRGWNKTKIVPHANGAAVDVYRTVDVVRGVNGTSAAIHLNGASISRYLVPSDLNYLCRQIAALMLKKAQGGFAGKTGNDELGTVTYNNEFPMIAMKEIKNNYRIYRL